MFVRDEVEEYYSKKSNDSAGGDRRNPDFCLG
jgi:hypothetical protein